MRCQMISHQSMTRPPGAQVRTPSNVPLRRQRDRYQSMVRRTASGCGVVSNGPNAASNLEELMTKGSAGALWPGGREGGIMRRCQAGSARKRAADSGREEVTEADHAADG